MSERVHDHTLHHLRVHGRTGTRTNRYSIIQYSIYRYTIYRYLVILFYIKLWHVRIVILSNWYIIYWYFDEQNTIKRVHDRTGTRSYATPSTGTRANRHTGEQVFQRKLYQRTGTWSYGDIIILWHNIKGTRYTGYIDKNNTIEQVHDHTVTRSNRYTIYGYTGEQVHGRTGTWANRYTGERVHDRTVTWSYATLSTGTRANRYTGEQVFWRTITLTNSCWKLAATSTNWRITINDWNISLKGSGGYVFQIWSHNMAVHELYFFTIPPLNHI